MLNAQARCLVPSVYLHLARPKFDTTELMAAKHSVPTPPAAADEASDAAVGDIVTSSAAELQGQLADEAGGAPHRTELSLMPWTSGCDPLLPTACIASSLTAGGQGVAADEL